MTSVRTELPATAPGVALGHYYFGPLLVPERHLPAGAFVAHDGSFHHVPILSVEADEGPRRIVLLEAFDRNWRGRGVRIGGTTSASPPELAAVLSVARPEDSLGLLVTGGPHIEVRLGSPRTDLSEVVASLSRLAPDGANGPDFLDGVLEATRWFGSPQPGDAILEFGMPDTWDRAKAKRVRAELTRREIRLFSLGGAYTEAGGDAGASGEWQSPLARLCDESGGGWENLAYLGVDAGDTMRWEWQNAAKALYDLAKFAYIVRLAKTGPRVKLQLTPATFDRPQWIHLAYPSPLPVCPPPAAPPEKSRKQVARTP
ncbi:MAG: hypothetical protein ABSB82_00595 [Terriglobia bacterium]